MKLKRLILGGMLAFVTATLALAETPQQRQRPIAREDLAALRQEAARARLASFRPNERPAHMLRYPPRYIIGTPSVRPEPRPIFMPDARWDHRRGSESWTWAAMSALAGHGSRLENTVPTDIAQWCPGYISNPPRMRRAFWVGMMSALAKHESTYNPNAVGGGGLWYGLLQIYPDTARRYGCRAQSGEALKDPEDNLSCAIRIMNVTVPRDNAIAVRNGRWRGVAADWGPMTSPAKIAEMSAWTRRQDYCQVNLAVMTSLRPQARPPRTASVLSTMNEG